MDHQIEICGRKYRLRHARRDMRHHGDCTNPDKPNRRIRIRRGLTDKQTLETLIHEMLHAGVWSLDEEYVTQVARDIATVLHDTLGWRPS